MIYQEESLDTFLVDGELLLSRHWKELANHQQDRPLDPDWDKYRLLNKAGVFKVFTARNPELAGYAWFFLSDHPHYQTWKYAACDIYYVTPQYRRTRGGLGLFTAFEPWLKAQGVQAVVMHDKVNHPHDKLFLRLGYTLVERHYEKRL